MIFPESELAGLDQREMRRINWGQRALYTGALGCLIVFGLVWDNSFSSNHQGLERLQTIGQTLVRHKKLLNEEDDALAVLQALNISYAANHIFPPSNKSVYCSAVGYIRVTR